MISKKVRQIFHRKPLFNFLIKKGEQSSPHIYFVNVDPEAVSHISLMPKGACSLSGPDAMHGSFNGCFDMIKARFKNNFMYQTVEQLLNEEDWEATSYFKKLLKYKSHEKTLAHYKKLQRLITILEKDGYLSQYELGRADITARIGKWEVPRHEMFIGMDRKGQLFRIKGGRHRLAIAQNIGIEEIPAILTLYHKNAEDKLPVKHRVIEGKTGDYRPFEEEKYEVEQIK